MKRKKFPHKLLKAECFLTATLVIMLFSLVGCGKVGVKDPVFVPGFGESFKGQTAEQRSPVFQNGDVVCYRMNKNKKGIVMQADYKYVPRLGAWYCVVDFYPSSALLHFDFSGFDNYERRYVYEYELELTQSYKRQAHTMPAQWQFMELQIVQ
jgi:hypothetical protein